MIIGKKKDGSQNNSQTCNVVFGKESKEVIRKEKYLIKNKT